MDHRYWQYTTARAMQGIDFIEATQLTELGLNGWEAYAALPDEEHREWVIFLKREVDEKIAQQIRR